MSYRVLYTEQFHDALDAQVEYFVKRNVPQSRIASWLNDLLHLMDSLDELPERYPVASAESALSGVELRKVVFGDYLAFYHVDHSNRVVHLLGFRHGARLP